MVKAVDKSPPCKLLYEGRELQFEAQEVVGFGSQSQFKKNYTSFTLNQGKSNSVRRFDESSSQSAGHTMLPGDTGGPGILEGYVTANTNTYTVTATIES